MKVFVYHRSNSNINKSLSLFEDGGRGGACERDVIIGSPKRASYHLENKFSKMSCVFDRHRSEYAREKPQLIYGSFGVKVAEHHVHRCSNCNKFIPCRIGAFYGYITIDGEKIYTPECLKNEFLVVSNQTAFERDYLIEVVADIYLLQGCFENISKKFNRLKNRQLPTATQERRTELYRKTLTNGFFLYAFLEYGQRYAIKGWQRVKGSVEETVMDLKDELAKSFQERWTKVHKCDDQDASLVL